MSNRYNDQKIAHDADSARAGINVDFTPESIGVYYSSKTLTIPTSGDGSIGLFDYSWISDKIVKVTNLQESCILEFIGSENVCFVTIAKDKRTSPIVNVVEDATNMFKTPCKNVVSWSLGRYSACISSMHHHFDEFDVLIDGTSITVISNVQKCTAVIRLLIKNDSIISERLCIVKFACALTPPGPVIVVPGDSTRAVGEISDTDEKSSAVNNDAATIKMIVGTLPAGSISEPNAEASVAESGKGLQSGEICERAEIMSWNADVSVGGFKSSASLTASQTSDAAVSETLNAVSAIVRLFAFVVYAFTSSRRSGGDVPTVKCDTSDSEVNVDLRTVLNLPASTVVTGAVIDGTAYYAGETTPNGISIASSGTLTVLPSIFTTPIYDITIAYDDRIKPLVSQFGEHTNVDGSVNVDSSVDNGNTENSTGDGNTLEISTGNEKTITFLLECASSKPEKKINLIGMSGRDLFVPFTNVFPTAPNAKFSPSDAPFTVLGKALNSAITHIAGAMGKKSKRKAKVATLVDSDASMSSVVADDQQSTGSNMIEPVVVHKDGLLMVDGSYVRNDGFVVGADRIGSTAIFNATDDSGAVIGTVSISTTTFTPLLSATDNSVAVSLGHNEIPCVRNLGFAWFESESVQERKVFAVGSTVVFDNICTFTLSDKTVYLDIDPLNASKLPKMRYAVLNSDGSVKEWHSLKFKLKPDAGDDHIVIINGQSIELCLQDNDYNPSEIVREMKYVIAAASSENAAAIDKSSATSTLSFKNDRVKITGDSKGNIAIRTLRNFVGPAFEESIVACIDNEVVPITITALPDPGQPKAYTYVKVCKKDITRGEAFAAEVSALLPEENVQPGQVDTHNDIASYIFEGRSYTAGSVAYCKSGVLCVYADRSFAFSPKISTNCTWQPLGDIVCFSTDGSYAFLSLQEALPIELGPYNMYVPIGQKSTVALQLPDTSKISPPIYVDSYGFTSECAYGVDKSISFEHGSFKSSPAGIVKVHSIDNIFGTINMKFAQGTYVRNTTVRVIPLEINELLEKYSTHSGKLSFTSSSTDATVSNPAITKIVNYTINANPDVAIAKSIDSSNGAQPVAAGEVATVAKYAHFKCDADGKYDAWISSAYAGTIDITCTLSQVDETNIATASASANASTPGVAMISKFRLYGTGDAGTPAATTSRKLQLPFFKTKKTAPVSIVATAVVAANDDVAVRKGRSASASRNTADVITQLQKSVRTNSPNQPLMAESFQQPERNARSQSPDIRRRSTSATGTRTYLMYPGGTVLPQSVVANVPEGSFTECKIGARTVYKIDSTFEYDNCIFRNVVPSDTDSEQMWYILGAAGVAARFPTELPITGCASTNSDKITTTYIDGEPVLKVLRNFADDEILEIGVFLRGNGECEHYSTLKITVLADQVLPSTIKYNSKRGVSLSSPLSFVNAKPSGSQSVDIIAKFPLLGQSWSGTVNFVDDPTINEKLNLFAGYGSSTRQYVAFFGKTPDSLKSDVPLSRSRASSMSVVFDTVSNLFASATDIDRISSPVIAAAETVEQAAETVEQAAKVVYKRINVVETDTVPVSDATIKLDAALKLDSAEMPVTVSATVPITLSDIGKLGTDAALAAKNGDLDAAKELENAKLAAIRGLKRTVPKPSTVSENPIPTTKQLTRSISPPVQARIPENLKRIAIPSHSDPNVATATTVATIEQEPIAKIVNPEHLVRVRHLSPAAPEITPVELTVPLPQVLTTEPAVQPESSLTESAPEVPVVESPLVESAPEVPVQTEKPVETVPRTFQRNSDYRPVTRSIIRADTRIPPIALPTKTTPPKTVNPAVSTVDSSSNVQVSTNVASSVKATRGLSTERLNTLNSKLVKRVIKAPPKNPTVPAVDAAKSTTTASSATQVSAQAPKLPNATDIILHRQQSTREITPAPESVTVEPIAVKPVTVEPISSAQNSVIRELPKIVEITFFAPKPVQLVRHRYSGGRSAAPVATWCSYDSTVNLIVGAHIPIPVSAFGNPLTFGTLIGTSVKCLNGALVFDMVGKVAICAGYIDRANVLYTITVLEHPMLGVGATSIIPTVDRLTDDKYAVGDANTVALYIYSSLTPTACKITNGIATVPYSEPCLLVCLKSGSSVRTARYIV